MASSRIKIQGKPLSQSQPAAGAGPMLPRENGVPPVEQDKRLGSRPQGLPFDRAGVFENRDPHHGLALAERNRVERDEVEAEAHEESLLGREREGQRDHAVGWRGIVGKSQVLAYYFARLQNKAVQL